MPGTAVRSRTPGRLLAVVAALLVLVVAGAAPRVQSGSQPSALTLSEATAAVTSGELPTSPVRARAAATWCGAATREDLTPNAVAGHPVHWVYAFPSDGADRMTELGSAMQTDAETIDAWWRSQDPARAPRSDVAPFPCGVQLDLTTLRLQGSSASLATPQLFANVRNELIAAGLSSPFAKYLVYFDGPVANDRICGQGSLGGSGFGLAIVYLRACSGVVPAAVAAHEILHTLGAVPRGAPNDCPEPNDGHTCDNTSDIMYPSIRSSELLTSKALDPGRNDYYGHSAAVTDTQDAPWLVRLDAQAPFQVGITGTGHVEADVPGLECAQSCTTTWNASTRLNLTAVPGAGMKFVRWGGLCFGSSSCVAIVNPGATATALFAPLTYPLKVAISGRGTVRGTRIACRPRCSAAVPSYVPLRLVATAAKGWKFRSWRGACRGTRPSCSLPMSAAASARAVFVRA